MRVCIYRAYARGMRAAAPVVGCSVERIQPVREYPPGIWFTLTPNPPCRIYLCVYASIEHMPEGCGLLRRWWDAPWSEFSQCANTPPVSGSPSTPNPPYRIYLCVYASIEHMPEGCGLLRRWWDAPWSEFSRCANTPPGIWFTLNA